MVNKTLTVILGIAAFVFVLFILSWPFMLIVSGYRETWLIVMAAIYVGGLLGMVAE